MTQANTKKSTKKNTQAQVFTLTQEQLSSIIAESVKKALVSKETKEPAVVDNSKELNAISKEIDKQRKIISEANKVLSSLEDKFAKLGGVLDTPKAETKATSKDVKATSKDVETVEIHYWISQNDGFGKVATSNFNSMRMYLARSAKAEMSKGHLAKYNEALKGFRKAVKDFKITKVIFSKESVILLKQDKKDWFALSLKNLKVTKGTKMAKVSKETLQDMLKDIVVYDKSELGFEVKTKKA